MNTSENSPRRTFNTDIRSPWNPVIHQLLKAIEYHVHNDLKNESVYHREQAALLREYLRGLKDWITSEEARRVKLEKE